MWMQTRKSRCSEIMKPPKVTQVVRDNDKYWKSLEYPQGTICSKYCKTKITKDTTSWLEEEKRKIKVNFSKS